MMIPLAIANVAISLNMHLSRFRVRRPFLKAINNFRATQEALLHKILQENSETVFGCEHGFSDIESLEEFRKRVPVSTYDILEPYVVQQQSGGAALTAEPPVYYARTSGTTGRYKDIPLTKYGVGQIAHVQKQLAFSLWDQTKLFDGVVLGFSSPGYEGYLPNGTPYGSTSGATYQSLSPILEGKFGIPSDAFTLKDIEAKYEVYALVALARDNVTGVVTVNPSSLLKVCTIIDEQQSALVSALHTGNDDGLREQSRSFLPQIRKTISAGRRRELEQVAAAGTKLSASQIWPRLSTVVTWTGGSCGIALKKLATLVPQDIKIVEMGYASSEFIGTANIDVDRTLCLPLITDNFYEFVAKADWESDKPVFKLLDELVVGEEYYVFVTNRSGLYRYDINDLVQARDGINGCPSLMFVRKGKGVTNITGEKLSEDQIISAVTSSLGSFGMTAETFLALADEQASRYLVNIELDEDLAIDVLADRIDMALRESNGEYDDKRASGRLRPVIVRLLRLGTGQAIKAARVANGVRETQYKPPVLAYAAEWSDWLRNWCVEP